jgi:SET domain-containing protein
MVVSEQDKNFELQDSEGRGSGVFTKSFYSKGQVVMTGVMDKIVSINHVGVSQIGEHEYVAPVGFMALVNPNCGIKVNETGAHDYVAIRDIEPGEEVTFDYAMQNYKIGYFPGKCLCGSSECRGTVGGWVDLPKDKRKDYQGYVAPYLLELSNN